MPSSSAESRRNINNVQHKYEESNVNEFATKFLKVQAFLKFTDVEISEAEVIKAIQEIMDKKNVKIGNLAVFSDGRIKAISKAIVKIISGDQELKNRWILNGVENEKYYYYHVRPIKEVSN